MTEQKEEFLKYAVIEQLKYDEIEIKLGISRTVFSPWWEELKVRRIYLSWLRRLWSAKCPELNFYDFKNWYESVDKKCHYCGLTEEGMSILWASYPDLTKRNRGRKLEIDRKMPNEKYEVIDNLVLSCYWCNNAKTDTFTDAEFLKIGEVIKQIWAKRLHDKR